MSISKNATLQEIESYGSSVQNGIFESMSKIMQDTKCIDLGQVFTRREYMHKIVILVICVVISGGILNRV